jgi:hypothetical protein
MAESQNDIFDLIRDSNDPNLYIYDPRARYKPRRHRRMSYDPRRRRRRSMSYDPRIRSFFGRFRRKKNGGAKGIGAKIIKGLNAGGAFAAGLAIGMVGASTAGDRAWIAGGQPTGMGKLKLTFVDALYRLSFGYINITQSVFGTNYNPSPQPIGWNWNKMFSSKYMWAGLGLFALSFVPGVPRRTTLKKFAFGLALGGGYGGGTDPSAPGSPGVLTSTAPARAGATPLIAAYSTGGRSQQGGAISPASAGGTFQ